MHCTMALPFFHKNNESSIYELVLIQTEGTKDQPCYVWTLSALTFLTDSWLIVSHFDPGYAITACSLLQLIQNSF